MTTTSTTSRGASAGNCSPGLCFCRSRLTASSVMTCVVSGEIGASARSGRRMPFSTRSPTRARTPADASSRSKDSSRAQK